MAERIDLLIIDPQVDFCCPNKGALYVPGAEKDMERIAQLIKNFGSKIKQIHVTLDCHHEIDIAHPLMWMNSDGKNPDPFTIISHKDVVDGIWFPIFAELPGRRKISAREYAKGYTKELEDSGRYPLCIWPQHCLIGSEGNQVMPNLYAALQGWEKEKLNNIDYVSKGSNPWTEHYSAIKAEVPDGADVSTQLNIDLIKTLMNADTILIAGEAGSHCVKNTVEDIADGFNNDSCIKKLVLLEDGVSPVVSPVVDFPAIQAQFIIDMKARGMRTANTVDFGVSKPVFSG